MSSQVAPPPTQPPLSAPTVLVVADCLTWSALSVGAAGLSVAAGLLVADGCLRKPRLRSRAVLAWFLRGAALMAAASACLPYYAEARFSVMSEWHIAGINNPFVRTMNNQFVRTIGLLNNRVVEQLNNLFEQPGC